MKSSIGFGVALLCLFVFFTACEDTGSEPTDKTPPVPGGDGLISFFDPSPDSLWISWLEAEDDTTAPERLMYRVYYSDGDNLQYIEDVQYNGILAMDWQENTTTAYLSGLPENSEFYVNVLVQDNNGNTACYTSKRVITLPGPSSAFSMTSPTSHAYVSGSQPTLNYTFNDPMSTLSFTLNGTSWFGYDGDIIWSAILGLNTLEATVTDQYGISTTETVVFFYWDDGSGSSFTERDDFDGTVVWSGGFTTDSLLYLDGGQLVGTDTIEPSSAYETWYRNFDGTSYKNRLFHLGIQELQPGSTIELLMWTPVTPSPTGQVGLQLNAGTDGTDTTVGLNIYEFGDGVNQSIAFSPTAIPVNFSTSKHLVFYNDNDRYQAALADENLDIITYVYNDNYTRVVTNDFNQYGFSFYTTDTTGMRNIIFRADEFSFEVR